MPEDSIINNNEAGRVIYIYIYIYITRTQAKLSKLLE